MPAASPSRTWERLDLDAKKFALYVLDHPGTTHHNFYKAYGVMVKSSKLNMMLNDRLLEKGDRVRIKDIGYLVYTYYVSDLAVKFLLEKREERGD